MNALRRRITMLAAIALVVVFYAFARLPGLSQNERSELAAKFRFTRLAMPDAPNSPPFKYVRAVHPSLKRISGWISAVGAGVALADLDGDGLSNDLCHVEPRTDQVIVSPAPGTGARYAPFTLDAAPLPYNASTTAPMGCLAGDLNEDGLMDLVVYYWGRTPVAFLRKSGTPGESKALAASDFIATEIVSTGERWYTNAAFFADIDGDGHFDLVIGNYFQDGGRILDASAGGIEAMHNTKSKSYNAGRKHVLLWAGATAAPNPGVQYREATGVFNEQVSRGWALGAGAADLDGDLLPEIYFAHDFGPDRLLHNRSTPGHPRFVELQSKRGLTTPASFVMGQDSFKGMGVDFGDVNGDGILDIYVSNIADEYALTESHFLWLSTGKIDAMQRGEAPYVQASERLGLSRSGWGWDTRLSDFDNDGLLDAVQATGFLKGKVDRWPELQSLGTGNDELMTNPNYWPSFRPGDDLSGHNQAAFFTRDHSGHFQNINTEIGLGDPMVSRGIAVADIDGDGRLDFAIANQWEPSFVFHNDSPNAGEFLGIHLLLPLKRGETLRERAGHPGRDLYGRPAIGAAAAVHVSNDRALVAQVDGGSGHSGKRSPDLHFGLGRIARGSKLTVDLRWRDPDGAPHSQTIALAPGWHTVVLGWPEKGRPEKRS